MHIFRFWSAVAALVVVPAQAALLACEIAWPDPTIPVPAKVRAYITAECREYQGSSEESFDDCVKGETYGYRAVVTILMDDALGEAAARRYRGCAAGLGNLGGRFHRRKAECVSVALGIVWRFDYSEEAHWRATRKAGLLPPATAEDRRVAMQFALSVIE